ncbi:MAG: DUF2889 domain-containing protein [Deltaproteobacteria bacterium]|nr:DUF2889 domain-containing protein [Deltaproteobacteria bacterium]
MHLDLRGHPLHSRGLTVTLLARLDGQLDARAVLIDLRKRGLVPVGGDLGTPGIVHHMRLEAVIDPATRRLNAISAQQPNVAFEPGELTGGESCRDPIAAILGLEGATLDAGFARRLSAVFGGPRGCSHILTLAQVLAAATSWALDTAGEIVTATAWRPGERVFRRDLLVDGSQRADGDLDLAAQLTDLVFAPAPAVARPMDRFTTLHEVRVWAPVELATVSLGEVTAAERRRDKPALEAVDWADASPRLAGLAGLSLFRGISAALMARLSAPADRPLLDAMLMLAPTFIQVCGAISEGWPARAAAADSILGMGGMPDSCFMWRKGGPLDRLRSPKDPIPTF